MPILKSSNQPSMTVEAFYQDLAAKPDRFSAARAKAMLRLIPEIDRLFPTTPLYGLTSHDRLVLLSSDSWKSPWFVILSGASIEGHFAVQYLLPEAVAPWPGATVHGEAQDLDECLRFILLAMRECGAWPANAELYSNLRERGLMQ